MINSREIIEHDTTPEQWEDFERKVEMLEPKELAAIAQRLSLDISSDAHWRDFLREFGRQNWWDFTEAYEHVMATSY